MYVYLYPYRFSPVASLHKAVQSRSFTFRLPDSSKARTINMDPSILINSRNQDNLWNIPVVYGEVLCTGKEKGKDTGIRSSEDVLANKGLTYEQSANLKSIDFHRVIRDTLPVLYVKGSFYEVGFRIGRTFSTLIQQYICNHRDIQLYCELYETAKGKEVFNSCYNATARGYPEHIREIHGIADGANVPIHKLFLLHMEDIMLVALPSSQKRPMPLNGSTTLIVTNEEEQILGHVVDQAAVALGNLYVINAEITECCPPQEFSAVCIGGMLPGALMGFNNHGLVFSVDSIPIRKPNECGIPRSVICRAILGANSYRKVENVLRCEGYGIGNGVSICVSILHPRVLSRIFRCYEAGPRYPAHSNSSVSYFLVQPSKRNNYYHLNKFERLNSVQEKLHESYAKWILSRDRVLKSFDDGTLGHKTVNILGDSSISSLQLSNIYTSVESQGVVSVAVGVFDFIAENWSLYLDNPKEKNPTLVIPLVSD